MKKRIEGIVVLYRPDSEVETNIRSYIGDLVKLYAIDNSESPDPEITDRLKKIPGLEYIPAGENKGIAWALNRGVDQANADGADYLLTMDQDSRASGGMLGLLLAGYDMPESDRIGIVSPFHVYMGNEVRSEIPLFEDKTVVMTSGNLLNLKAYSEVGKFDEKLFIDGVDQEYCLRLKTHGYRIVQAQHIPLIHQLGKEASKSVLSKSFRVTNHNPIRRYYITRNRLYINSIYGKIFPEYCRYELKRNRVELVKIILGEKEKFKKIKMILKAKRDFKRGKFGKIE